MKITVFAVGAMLAFSVPVAIAAQMAGEAAADQFETTRAQQHSTPRQESWVQPENQPQDCKVVIRGPAASYTARWLGSCRDGRASGLGISTIHYDGATQVVLEDYGESRGDLPVTYREVTWNKDGKAQVLTGLEAPDSCAVEVLKAGKSPEGNSTLEVTHAYCFPNGETVSRTVDATTGSVSYAVFGSAGYSLTAAEFQEANKTLFSEWAMTVDGKTVARKLTVDGMLVDNELDEGTGQLAWTMFSSRMNDLIALPPAQFTSANDAITNAVSTAEEKFAQIRPAHCEGQTDADIKTFCDPSPILPSEADIAASSIVFNQRNRAAYESKSSQAIAINERLQAYQQQHAQQAYQQPAYQQQAYSQQQAYAQQQTAQEEIKRQQNRQVLLSGIESLRQIGQNAQQAAQQMNQSYNVPQVQAPQLHQTGILTCRTIGYITTCN